MEQARQGRRTLILGILNVTPDLFSDGGQFVTPETALKHAEQMAADGADLIDIGGELTRPSTFRSNTPLEPGIEAARILPIIRLLSERLPSLPISVDTYKAAVAQAALDAGAVMVNDISALRADPEMARTVAQAEVPVCLMHLPGLPMDIPPHPVYTDVVQEVRAHLEQQANVARFAGIPPERILIDPGFGFGKTVEENLEILRRLREITDLPYRTLLGTSRKSTIGKVLGGLPPEERLEGTAATIALAIAAGVAVVRVHDVKPMARVARMADAIVRGWP